MIDALDDIIKSHIEKKDYNKNGTTIFFIEKAKLTDLDISALRSQVRTDFKASQFVQIIGDSNPFSKIGHKKAVDHLT